MEKKTNFFEEWGYIISSVLTLVGLLFLFAPLVTLETNVTDVDTTVTSTLGFVGLCSYEYGGGWLIISVFVLVVLSIILTLLSGVIKKHSSNILTGALFCNIIAICGVIVLKDVFGYYAANDSLFEGVETAWGAAATIVSLTLGAFFALTSTKYGKETSVRDMAEDAVLIATAFVLNFIKFFQMPTGGSVNLQMLPLMIIAIRKGPAHGFVAGGVIYGLLTCLTDGYGFYCYPFDYLIGFGSVAIMGFCRPWILGENQKTYNVKGILAILISGILATTIRFFAGCVSSIVYYGSNFGEAALYNVGYVYVSGALAIAVLIALYGPLCRLEKAFPSKKPSKAVEQ